LIIGINYIDSQNQLNGCINDAHSISAFLNQQYGFAYDDMVILTDDQQSQLGQPTRANILRAMTWLVQDAQPHDSLFFHYSGHGGQTLDENGDHIDGYDETIFPVDFQETSQIISDVRPR
jgi:metacaspase-1